MRKTPKILDVLIVSTASLLLSSIAQSAKKTLTENDYGRWETLMHEEISTDGQWVSYSITQDASNSRTLFVKNVRSGAAHTLPSCSDGSYSRDSRWYACLMGSDMVLINLRSGEKETVNGVSRFAFSPDGTHIAAYASEPPEGRDRGRLLSIRNLQSGSTRRIENVTDFRFSPVGSRLAYVTEHQTSRSVELIDLAAARQSTVASNDASASYSKLTWHRAGKSLAFLQEMGADARDRASQIVHLYSGNHKSSRLRHFDHREAASFPSGSRVSGPEILPARLIISDDAQTVFFTIESTHRHGDEQATGAENSSNVQIWHVRDKVVHPGKGRILRGLCAWRPDENKLVTIASVADDAEVILTRDQKYALTIDAKAYKPALVAAQAQADVYIVNTATGERKLLLEGQLIDNLVLVSPGGRFVSYFKDENWWVFDVAAGTHTNVTKDLGGPVYDEAYDRAGTPPPHGSPGWSLGDKEILVYDQYDIWAISPDGRSRRRLSNGRAKGIAYRIYDRIDDDPGSDYSGRAFDLSKELIFSAVEVTTRVRKSGYFRWDHRSGVQALAFDDARIDLLMKARDEESYVYRRQRFDVPPALIHVDGRRTMTVARSNTHHEDYYWGRSELIDYTCTDRKRMQGALFYPADYRPGVQYPMVVHIYERRSQNLHDYINPGLLEQGKSAGYANPAVLTTRGYFVLEPDIAYRPNEPGISALECVTAAVERVTEADMVDRNKVGLFGFSFGGYETSFIVTQTDLFAAAVAGAAPTDLVSHDLSIVGFLGTPSYESVGGRSHQMRLGVPHFDLDAYLRNSPVHNAMAIKTPLLTFFGDSDENVDWRQGIELHLAMRRGRKQNVFLVYPGENHQIEKPENVSDLHHRVMDWFDHYLKGEKAAAWIVNGDDHGDAPADKSSQRTSAVYLSSNEEELRVRVNGRILSQLSWMLTDANPDVWDLQLKPGETREVCLVSESGAACRTLKEGTTGVYVVKYQGKEYVVHIIG